MRNFLILALAAIVSLQIACKPGSTQTEHGFRFINHTNTGGVKPQPSETVLVQTYTYIGDSLMASTQKNYGGPREFVLFEKDKLPKRVPALYDAVLLMGEGDSATIYETIDTFLQKFIPPSLKDAKEVRYEIVLKDVLSAEDKAKAEAEKAQTLAASQARLEGVQTAVQAKVAEYTAGKLKDQLVTTPSGLKILIVEKGSGAPLQKGETIKTDYFGCLNNGTMFDNSFSRGTPLSFPVGVGQMIPGYDEGALQLNHGGKAYFFLPYQLGYGEAGQGPIPPKSDLVFYVEIL